MSLAAKAETLLVLHQPGEPVVLPTVWDAWSAAIAVEAGFQALTIGSHPAAEALGRDDGEDLSLDEMLAQVRLVAGSVDLPVSADLESGYGESPARVIEGLLEAGAVGLNIEDTVHSEGGRLRSDAEHADYIGGLRAAADASGVHVVVNARTDILLRQIGPAADRLERAMTRLEKAAAAGADVLYPVGGHTDEVYRALTSRLPKPVNAIGRPADDQLQHFADLGVARISFGPYLQRALGNVAVDILAGWLKSGSR